MKRILLVDDSGKSYLVTPGQRLETNLGVFEIPISWRPGQVLRSHLSRRGVLLMPGIRDYVERMRRPTRIPHFEDIGYILAHAGLGEDQIVVEAGTGSGCTAIYFSVAVGSGRVITFERRLDVYEVARENVAGFGCENVEILQKDLAEKPPDLKANLFFLDLASPSSFVELAYASLEPGGTVAIYAPFMEEGVACLRILKSLGAQRSGLTEIVRREYENVSAGTRPRTTQTVHTGYLVLGRYVSI